jgi:activator of Hsp90 ATPase-like protein
MTTTIVTPDLDAIASEIHVAAPADRVFKALTEASELQRWFTGPECPVKFWKMDARVGGRYSYAPKKLLLRSMASTSSNATERFWSAIHHDCSSTPGLATGMTTQKAAQPSVGNSRQREIART